MCTAKYSQCWRLSSTLLMVPLTFGATLAWGYSPPDLTNSAYRSGYYATQANLPGQCTWYAYGRIQEVGLVTASKLADWPNRSGASGIFMGKPSDWLADANYAHGAGYPIWTDTTPQAGALAVWSNGADQHIAFVEAVTGDTIRVTECNFTPTPTPNTKESAYVVVGSTDVKLYSMTDLSSSVVCTLPQFTAATVVGKSPGLANNYQWFELSDGINTGYAPWMKQDLSGPAETSGIDNAWWNITQFKSLPGSPWWSATQPTYIHFTSEPPSNSLNFSDFSVFSQLQLNGKAVANFGNGIDLDPVLRLTDSARSETGSAFSKVPIGAATFSSFFEFRITNPDGYLSEKGADGIVFVVQSVGNATVGAAGGSFGYQGISNSVGIVIDTYQNAEHNDPSGNYVGIDLNGNVDHPVPATYVQNIDKPLNDGNLWYCWVDYNGTTLEVRINQTGIRPTAATLSEDLDLVSILGQTSAYVGFTAATGNSWENHDIVSWTYAGTGGGEGEGGTTIVVNTTMDVIYPDGSGMISLRNAIDTASSSASPTTIAFDPTVFGTPQTIVMAHGQFVFGNGSQPTTIIGPAAGVTIDGNNASRVFEITRNADVSATGITITNGNANAGWNDGYGGAICIDGGYHDYVISLTDCTITGNRGMDGAAIALGGVVTLKNVTFSNNVADTNGGAIDCGGTVTMINVTFSGNTAGGEGGAIRINGNGNATLYNTTITDNKANIGGGICNHASPTSYFRLANTIVAANTSTGNGPDAYGNFNSLGHNLIGVVDDSTGWDATDMTGTKNSAIVPRLGVLAANDGPTLTIGLLADSAAVNAGSNSLIPSGVTTDQRGLPRIVNGNVDIGAFELQQGESITVGEGEYEGEGEVNPPATIEEAAQDLVNVFNAADNDHSGGLSEAEAMAALPGLFHDQFAQLDVNGDGQVTLDELNQMSQGSGCNCAQSNSAISNFLASIPNLLSSILAVFG